MALLQLIQQNVAAAAAYTEYSVRIPPRVNEVTLALRLSDVVNWYMVPTNGSTPGASSNLPQSPNTYGTIPAGASRTIRGMLGAQTIYFQVPTSQVGQILEVDYYADT